jgi:hypothetical protein
MQSSSTTSIVGAPYGGPPVASATKTRGKTPRRNAEITPAAAREPAMMQGNDIKFEAASDSCCSNVAPAH